MPSVWQNIGHTVKKAVTDTGHAVGTALNNPVVKGLGAAALGATGVGLLPAAAIMGGAGVLGGAIRPGGGLKGAVTQGGQGALLGAGGSLAGSLVRDGLPGAVKTAAGKVLPGAGKMAMSTLVPGGGSLSLGGVGDFLKDNALGLGMGALGAKQIGDERQAADDLVNHGLNTAHKAYEDKAELRRLSLSQLTAPSLAPNLSGRFDTGAVNPYAKKMPMSALRSGGV